MGKALKGRRDNVVLATKVHGKMGDDPNEFGNSRRWIVREVENSLRRLGTDWIDLYQIHRPEPDTDIDETLGALSDLVHAGQGPLRRVRRPSRPADRGGAVGGRAPRPRAVRDASSRRTRCSCAAIEADVLPTCARYGMGVIPWSPLAGGWLSGRYRLDTERRDLAPGADDPGPLRHVDSREPAQAGGRRRAGAARRGGGHDPDRDGDRVRDPPPGRHRGDHRPAHDGAPRVAARAPRT